MDIRNQHPELRPLARRRGGGGGDGKSLPRKRSTNKKYQLRIKELKAQQCRITHYNCRRGVHRVYGVRRSRHICQDMGPI
jgi:hypothetical protein